MARPNLSLETLEVVSSAFLDHRNPWALWIGEDQRDRAERAGYTVVDPPSIIATHLTEVIKRNAAEILGRQEVKSILDTIKKDYPAVVDDVTQVLGTGEVQKVLGRRIRLQSLAEATLGRGKSGDGMKAGDWWREGKKDLVRQYCIDDVRLTRELYDHAMKNGTLKYKDLREVRDRAPVRLQIQPLFHVYRGVA